ncbi:hypothetical protein U9M48_014136, partial [Paspalum notatum var. saurae]
MLECLCGWWAAWNQQSESKLKLLPRLQKHGHPWKINLLESLINKMQATRIMHELTHLKQGSSKLFLDVLNDEFDLRRQLIFSKAKWPSLDDIISSIIEEETRLRHPIVDAHGGVDAHAALSMKDKEELGTRRIIGTRTVHNGLYYLNEWSDEVAFVAKMSPCQELLLLHRRLGHPSFTSMSRTYPHIFKGSLVCGACEFAKHKRVPYPSLGLRRNKPFDVIHSDVWGPCEVHSISGHR